MAKMETIGRPHLGDSWGNFGRQLKTTSRRQLEDNMETTGSVGDKWKATGAASAGTEVGDKWKRIEKQLGDRFWTCAELPTLLEKRAALAVLRPCEQVQPLTYTDPFHTPPHGRCHVQDIIFRLKAPCPALSAASVPAFSPLAASRP